MKPATIMKALGDGYTVTYTIRRLRGYLHGDASLVLTPLDGRHGLQNIQHKLKCFRFDEKPYDNPRWVQSRPPLCDQCQALCINGVKCHEHGCPVAWKDKPVDCFQCGYAFKPDVRGQRLCGDCIEDNNTVIEDYLAINQ